MRLALYQPDIPQNTGTIMRFCACMGVELDIIEPCGFVLDDRRVKRAHMDYLEHLKYERHANWEAFLAQKGKRRLILMTTKTDQSYTDFEFQEGDIIMAGRESAGVPQEVADIADHAITIPMMPGLRSLNVAMSCAMVLGEAKRQTGFNTEG